ncbi:MAG: sugar phosphate nucleotidyltransferase [Pseudomonadota bacterium]
MATIYPVIMAGGSGTRLWPVSRSSKPKQFHAMLGDASMFQDTLARLGGQVSGHSFAAPTVIGGVAFADLIEAQLVEAGLPATNTILEPMGRNTAAVAAIASAVPEDDDGLVLLMPSDAYMAKPEAFRDAVATAADTAAKGYIMTFGIKPTHAETGYGYIQAGDRLSDQVSEICAFREKPTPAKAEAYFQDAAFSWNAGIFLFSAATMAEELKRYAPEILDTSLKALDAAKLRGPARLLDADLFRAVPEDSIDYAVMENTKRGAVLGPLDCGWSDIGSWSAIADLSAEQVAGDVIELDTKGCYLRSDGTITLTAIGVEDLIIVAHEGAVLVAQRGRSQDVKTIVNQLKKAGRKDRY